MDLHVHRIDNVLCYGCILCGVLYNIAVHTLFCVLYLFLKVNHPCTELYMSKIAIFDSFDINFQHRPYILSYVQSYLQKHKSGSLDGVFIVCV